MSNLPAALWVETLKARRSRVPLLTALGFLLAPLAGGFFMIVLKDPEFARRAGLISTKAQIVAGVADWPTYLGLLAQSIAVGGILLFGLIGTWVFGREYADRTVGDLLALPTSRSTIVLAKFIVVAAWSATLSVMVLLVGLGLGALIVLPRASAEVLLQGGVSLAVTAGLTIMLVTPITLFAGLGGGYLPPMGVSILALVLAQILGAAGWGDYFPWSVPALYAGVSGAETAGLGAVSYFIVMLTSLGGMIGTFVWWEYADQTR